MSFLFLMASHWALAAGLSTGRANSLIVTTTAYGPVGQLAAILIPQGRVSPQLPPIHSDAIVRAPLGAPAIYVVNRLGADNIQVVSKDLGTTIRQFTVGRRSNAQDIAVVQPDLAYVSRMNARRLLKVNPATGQSLGEPIDLSAYAYADGVPQMARMRLDGRRLLVQLQRLNVREHYAPTGTSYVAVIDTNSDAVTKAVTLAFTNPTADFKSSGSHLYVGGAGAWGKPDGGIEEFDASSFTSQRRVIDEAALGGDLLDFEILSDKRGVAIVSTPATKLVSFDPSTGQRLAILADSEAFTFMQLLKDEERGVFYLIDRDDRHPSVRVFDSTSLAERTDARWDLNLPPYQMVLSD